MRIKKLNVINFRALRDSTVEFSPTTAIVGENNCGKSAFLLALDLFFSSSPRLTDKDFSDSNLSEPIYITVHFSDLTPYDVGEFGSTLLDNELIVTRKFAFGNSGENGRYFVSARVNPEFSACRNESGKTEKRKLYAALREKYGNPTELQKEKNADEIDDYLEAWENAHPEELKIQRVGAFKGWTNVAAGKLKQKTSYVLIRAVQDAAEDIQQSKSSPVKTLIDALARQTIENSAAFQKFILEANKQIKDITDPTKVPMLSEISGDLTRILGNYYKDSEILASWLPINEIQPPFPATEIAIKSNGFVTGLEGVGHGLQRAVILTVLQFMAERQAKQQTDQDEFEEAQSDLIIAIEEPELYQHPIKQRLFGHLLRRLSDGFNKNIGIRIQTIFVTHSPLLISIADCESIRMALLRKQDGRRNVCVRRISLGDCALRSAELAGLSPDQAWSAERFAAKLHTFDTEIAEGLFGKCVVLVEGVGDVAILNAWFAVKGKDPRADGIVIVEVVGKNNLSRPILIFQALGIPCYWVFDSDKRKNGDQSKSANKILQRLAGVSEPDCMDWPEGRFVQYAAWDNDFEGYVKNKVGQAKYDEVIQAQAAHYDIEPNMCFKFPASAGSAMNQFVKDGIQFPELDELIERIESTLAI